MALRFARPDHQHDRQRAEAAKRFVERHKHVFSGNKDVVVTEYVEGARLELYYPLLQCGARPWFRGEKSLTGPSDRDKFDMGLSMIIKDPARRKEMLEKAIPALEALETWDAEHIHDCLIGLAEKLEVKNALLMWPVRIAAAGQAVTPGGAVEICHILGKEETLRRMAVGIEKLS